MTLLIQLNQKYPLCSLVRVIMQREIQANQNQQMEIVRYSHISHILSQITAKLKAVNILSWED